MATNPRQAKSDTAPEPIPEASQNKPEIAEVHHAEVPADGDAVADPSQQAATNSPPTDEAPTGAAEERALIKPERRNSNGKAAQFFTLPERLPIQMFSEETWLQKLGHWGPIVTGVASLVLTGFVWVKTNQLTREQIALQAKQFELQNQQADADLRFKFLADVTGTDGAKKASAEIALAQQGMKAFPVVHHALGVEQEDVRISAVNVVYKLFQAETNAGRDGLLQRLMEEFRSPNKALHTGIVQSFVKIESVLNPEQRRKVIEFLQQNVAPQNTCSDQDGREVVLEAAKFVGSKGDAIPYLLTVVNVPKCGDGWIQAMYNVQGVAVDLSPEQKSNLRATIEQIKTDVLDHLDRNISKQDLADGAGFTGFSNRGETGVTFENFKKRVRTEFDTLIEQLR